LFCPKVAYCQGLNFVAASLLLANFSEEVKETGARKRETATEGGGGGDEGMEKERERKRGV
jgi:hypothetical protein